MLSAIREKATGWIAWTVIILVGLGLVATLGVQGYSAGGGASVAAKVNDEEIHMNDFLREFGRQQSYYQQQMGDNYEPSFTERPEFKQNILDQLVTRNVVRQFLDRAGFRAGDDQIKDEIKDIEVFQEDGAFSVETYKRILRLQGYTEAAFREDIRADIVMQQFQNGISNTEFVTGFELEKEANVQHQQREVVYLKLSQKNFRDDIEITEDDIKAEYENSAGRYMTEPKAKVEYVLLDGADLVKDLPVTDEQIESLYADRKEKGLLTKDEERKASHILIKAEGELDDDAAKQKAEDLLKQIKDGADFAELAKEHSKDPGSAASGGDLGFFGRGAMVENFDKAVFEELQAPGDLSGVVESPFGFHIIRLDEIAGAATKTLDEVRDDLVSSIQMEQAGRLYSEKLQALKDITYAQPDTFADVPAELGLKVESSNWLGRRGGAGVLGERKVVEKVFDAEFVKMRENSDAIELSDTKAIVLRVTDFEEPTKKPLESVKAQIEGSLKYRRAVEAAKQAGEQVVAKLKDGGDLNALAEEMELEVTDAGLLKRDSTGHDRMLVAEVFKMEAPVSGEPTVSGVATVSGDYYVVELKKVQEGALASLEEEVVNGLEQRMSQSKQAIATQSIIEHLNKTADVVKFEDRL